MVPVELRLKNFLSYGTEAPPLRLDRFGVACLSGGNGQGKSALLDAMTWAVWGQARKSSGRQKPDEDILRIGTREMEVSLIFDIDGTRYRVERRYEESASGKTSKSSLELQVWEPEADRWRALTGASQRETQAAVTGTVGLDYDTFINSSFLLQGRSDEFTQKRPSERKEILTRILALGRYEALQDRARDRWRVAKNEKQRADAEVNRLEGALEDVDAWKEEQSAIEEKIEAQSETLAALQEEETALTERLAELRAKKEEADSIGENLEALDARVADLEDDAAGLREKIEDADALLAKSNEIQREAQRRETLNKERDALDEKRDLHRAVERQIEQRRSALKDKQNAAEKRLDKLRVQQQSDRKTLAEAEAQLARLPALREQLSAAEDAAEQLGRLRQQRDRRREVEKEMQEAAHRVKSLHGELRTRQEELHKQIEKEKDALAASDGLAEKVEALQAGQERLAELREKRERVVKEGRENNGRIEALRSQIEARAREAEKKKQALARLRDEDLGGQCPTCGTALDAEHRRRVARELEDEIEELREAIETKRAAKEECETRRETMQHEFTALRDAISELEEERQELATLKEKKRRREERTAVLEERTEAAQALDRKIEEKDFGQEARTRHRTLKAEREAMDFDEEAFEEVSAQAAQAEQYQTRLNELEEQKGRREKLETAVAQREEEITTLREDLSSGAVLGELPAQIEDFQEKLAGVGFQPERYEEVRRQLKQLADAGERMSRLLNARENRSSWKEQLERTTDRIAGAGDERTALKEKRAALGEALKEKPALEEKRHAKAEERRRHKETMSGLQSRRGQIAERLEQAGRDQEALEVAREERQESEGRRALYQHLKRAFGKHGIPSLIIEETLPSVEERANRLLDRLTDGQMHVSLETLRDKQSGGTTETLEINISDAQGATRAYETYSGGEGFRINFALRIALAQLMAERSGVRVRTLVIDEGFGTQDEQGIQNLVEAINTVQDDFEKILVITHLEELKNAFPVRIEVEKDPALGSTFEVNGV